MIRFDQSLQLRRLVIRKSGGALYDEKFHNGVNIIRGENSTGKSTIADYIFYVLGGESIAWSPEAVAADAVHAEVLLSGKVHTLTRPVEQPGKPPIEIFEGSYEEAMANRDKWLRYSSVRSINSESFSQILFRLLRLPEQRTEGQQNVTMHQILRLIYCDQMTPVDEIFRKEKFDNKDIRIAIAELLLGFDDLALHDIRLAIRATDREYGELVGELKSIFSVLGRTSDSDVAVVDFEAEFKRLEEEKRRVADQAEALSQQRDDSARLAASVRKVELAALARKGAEATRDAQMKDQVLALDVADSQEFVKTLNDRIEALDSSGQVADILGAATFTACPACLMPIEHANGNGACHLCKSPLTHSAQWGHLKMREELSFQLKESTQLLALKVEELATVRSELDRLLAEQQRIQRELGEFDRRVDPIDAEIAGYQKRLGYLDRSLEDLGRKAELAKVVQGKIDRRDALNSELGKLRSRLEAFESSRLQRISNVTLKIVELCIAALHRDLPMEEGFQNAKVVHFDFGQNRLTVDGRIKFSASSATYLKNAFLFSLFELSLQDAQVRWPRFILLDNIEDKGMQPKRSANFQKYVVERSSAYDVEHQIIMTTSMISSDLEDSDLCVGRHYAEGAKTLSFGKPSG